METLDLTKFDPKVEELNKLVEVSSKIVVTDINDKKQIEVVKENRIILKNTRVAITKTGKELRENALVFQRAVIAKEKELIAIIEPEELRLENIEAEVKALKLKEERTALLPTRHEQLNAIGDTVKATDEELLEMDTETFTSYKNNRLSAKLESDRLALEAEQAKVREEAERQEREKQAREREAVARKEEQELAEKRLALEKQNAELRVQQEKEEADRRVIAERERIEREQKAKEEREAKAKQEAEEKAKRDAEEAEFIAKAEQEKLEKAKKYQTWLKTNGYVTEEKENYYFADNGAEIKMYKLVSTFKK